MGSCGKIDAVAQVLPGQNRLEGYPENFRAKKLTDADVRENGVNRKRERDRKRGSQKRKGERVLKDRFSLHPIAIFPKQTEKDDGQGN